MEQVLRDAAERAIGYLSGIDARSVRPEADPHLPQLVGGPLPDGPSDPETVIATMDRVVAPATMAMAGPRFFGWVVGGTHPVALAADWMASAWDQNAMLAAATPGSVALEAAALRWIIDAGGLPSESWGGFVTGTTAAHITALATACSAVLTDVGWDVVNDGLLGAPAVSVVVGAEAHPSLFKALGIVGLGRRRVITVPTDDQGRMRAELVPPVEPPAIVCLQAGNVNSGAFDPMSDIVPLVKAQGAWVHVDGAFGFWAAASPSLAHLTAGQELADSWATDAHKCLNVPYDAGVVLVRDAAALQRAMSVSAAYLPAGLVHRDPMCFTPEMSRRARGVATWAVLRTLGRSGLAELIEGFGSRARLFARLLQEAGCTILNDVVFNQVLVDLGGRAATLHAVEAVQQQGRMFAGATTWHGRVAMRISVSSWKTTEEDVCASVEAIVRATSGDRSPVGRH